MDESKDEDGTGACTLNATDFELEIEDGGHENEGEGVDGGSMGRERVEWLKR